MSLFTTVHVEKWWIQSAHDSTISRVRKIISELNMSETVLWNICTFLKSSLSGAISNLSVCHIHIPQDLWLKLNQAEMAEKETTWSLTIMDRSWLVSGYCVYSAALCYSTGGRLAAATLRVADRAVSLRLTDAQMAGQVGPCLLLVQIIESGWTEDGSNCCLKCMVRLNDGWPH